MRKLIKWIFRKPITWIAKSLSSAPDEKKVFASLSHLKKKIISGKKNIGIIKSIRLDKDKIIIFSDQHKGTRDDVDDFKNSEKNYLSALDFYHEKNFHFVNLGDCEELWKNTPQKVIAKNSLCLESEKKFMENEHYYRIFGNHDLEWKYKLQQDFFLRPIFGNKIKVYEGLILKTTYKNDTFSIFLAHGHQGDQRSDGNPFSAWVVANIWTPIQRYLQISINTPATSFELTDKHNIIMHTWAASQKKMIFISGHTHKPVFASLDHIDRLTKKLDLAKKENNLKAMVSIQMDLKKYQNEYAGKEKVVTNQKPSYFNTGCCCFDDGDITGIEISDGFIRLVKWHANGSNSERIILEESELSDVFDQLQA